MYPMLDSEALAALRRTRPYPAVTLLMPTHRREPENAQDPVRLRNLLAEAKDRLAHDPGVTREARADVTEQLDRAVAEVDLVHAEDGLVVFAAPGEHQVWRLGRSVPERVVLSDTFLTRNLVAAYAAERPYWVVGLAADRVSLWSGVTDRVRESQEGAFPQERSLQPQDVEREERVGNVPSTFSDETTRQFFREAADALAALLRTHRRPVYVVGDTAALALFDEVGTFDRQAFVHVTQGGVAAGPADKVWHAVRPLVEEREREAVGAVREELDRARSRRTFAAGIDEVWENVQAGRVALLAVEEDYRETVRESDGHLVPAEADDLDALHDIVDDIVERALDTGAEVWTLPTDSLASSGRIASSLRY
ncbi:chemotaxis protein [Streptomyces sp. NPDC060194]|uniref:baeRF3 domain-containing protein n=1 Tax=Streptomyces sp. NPDC060194 TaxID=3347069 RepID=UPI003648C962